MAEQANPFAPTVNPWSADDQEFLAMNKAGGKEERELDKQALKSQLIETRSTIDDLKARTDAMYTSGHLVRGAARDLVEAMNNMQRIVDAATAPRPGH